MYTDNNSAVSYSAIVTKSWNGVEYLVMFDKTAGLLYIIKSAGKYC